MTFVGYFEIIVTFRAALDGYFNIFDASRKYWLEILQLIWQKYDVQFSILENDLNTKQFA